MQNDKSKSKENIDRRQFLRVGSGSAAAMLMSGVSLAAEQKVAARRPNILWISAEDMNPDLGCYGDGYAVTPNIDAFAARSVRYTNVYSHSGVCAPTRSGIITGMYPTTIGTHNMRCKTVPPAQVKCFSGYLREAGYYCTNNSKTDYQFDPPETAWDENSNKAHWRNRRKGQPFFAVFNLTVSHESRIRDRSESFQKKLAAVKPRHDPAKAVLPPYYPDTPTVRKDWAQYYDIVTLMDKQFADILSQLEQDGLAEETIVWFWADHGRGLPRAKRWIYDSGIHIPLIIHVPEKFRETAMTGNPDAIRDGSVNDALITFVDFAPTMLSLAGVKVPDYMQGRAFLGSQRTEQRKYIFAARDRMDEAYDIIRAVRDKRFKYIRNYMPYIACDQDIEYMNKMPTMQQMRSLNAEGKLIGPQEQYFRQTRPVEELYDTLIDPYEIHNLAANPKYEDILKRLRSEHQRWMEQTHDVGLIPEPELDEMKRLYIPHLTELLSKTDLLKRLRTIKALDGSGLKAIPHYFEALDDADASVRYWAVVGLHNNSKTGQQVQTAKPAIEKLLEDSSPVVRIAAADAMCDWGGEKQALGVLLEVMEHKSNSVRLNAAIALGRISGKFPAAIERIKAALNDPDGYVQRVARCTLGRLESRK